MEVDEAFPSFGLIRFIIRDNPYSNQSYPGETTNISKLIYIIVRDLKHKLRRLSFATKRTRKLESLCRIL